jgi:hypothetical protein
MSNAVQFVVAERLTGIPGISMTLQAAKSLSHDIEAVSTVAMAALRG